MEDHSTVPENLKELMTTIEEEIKSGEIHRNLYELRNALNGTIEGKGYNLSHNNLSRNNRSNLVVKGGKRNTLKKKKSIGGGNNEMKKIIFTMIFIIAFSTQYDRVSEYFECMILYSSFFWDKVIKPLFVVEQFVFKKEKSMTKYTLSLPFIGLTANEISIASIQGLYKKMIDSLKNGDVLAFNGLWTTWLNAEKFRLYLKETKTKVQPEKTKDMYEKSMKDLDVLIENLNTNNESKIIEIPPGSKLITKKSICI
jgi:hypothetical protein